jgi:tRNA G37 N-methylase TrmD
VYGGAPAGAGAAATYRPAGLETSGSLTGLILAQGRADGPTPTSRTAKVVVTMLVVLGILVVGGLVAAMLFSDAITQTLDQILGNQ